MHWSKNRLLVLALATVALLSIAAQVGALTPGVSLSSDRTKVTYPSVITLTANVASVTADTPTTATFELKTDDVGSIWVPVATVTSKPGAPGRFVAFSAPNPRNATYRVRIGDLEVAQTHVAVSVPMGKPVTTRAVIKVGQTAMLSGTIRPFHPSSAAIRLDFQKHQKAGWPKASATETLSPTVPINNDQSQWVRNLKPVKADVGSWRVRSFHTCPGHVGSYSAWTYYSVVR